MGIWKIWWSEGSLEWPEKLILHQMGDPFPPSSLYYGFSPTSVVGWRNILKLQKLCKLKVGGAFRERFVERTKKMYGPNPKTFRVGPIHRNFSLRQAVLSHHTFWADPHLKGNCAIIFLFLRNSKINSCASVRNRRAALKLFPLL